VTDRGTGPTPGAGLLADRRTQRTVCWADESLPTGSSTRVKAERSTPSASAADVRPDRVGFHLPAATGSNYLQGTRLPRRRRRRSVARFFSRHQHMRVDHDRRPAPHRDFPESPHDAALAGPALGRQPQGAVPLTNAKKSMGGCLRARQTCRQRRWGYHCPSPLQISRLR
jgi:hypothetical protein